MIKFFQDKNMYFCCWGTIVAELIFNLPKLPKLVKKPAHIINKRLSFQKNVTHVTEFMDS